MNGRHAIESSKHNQNDMKLWQKKEQTISQLVEAFTIGRDTEMDSRLALYDILGSVAHVKMLASCGLIPEDEAPQLVNALQQYYREVEQLQESGNFKLEPGMEDIHSQVEWWLTQKLGDAGKKIHSARSRNDQVLVDLKMYLRAEIEEIASKTHQLAENFLKRAEQHQHDLLPGFTHLQLAMPSSFGLWFSAWAESLNDDLVVLEAAFRVINRNPLGSAAGYGSSFPINRTLTTELLGFDGLNYNVVYAQMGRGKAEKLMATAMGSIAATLARFSMDACLYLSQPMGYIRLPESLTTGSSIMPHKKNPDVLELVRGHCNLLSSLPQTIGTLLTNLPSGYHRDLQLLKEQLFPAIDTLKRCLDMLIFLLDQMEVPGDLLNDEKYRYLFSVEEVNKLVLTGVPFRDAYRMIGEQIQQDVFKYTPEIHHTHEGSAGNLCLGEIRRLLDQTLSGFEFERIHQAYSALLR